MLEKPYDDEQSESERFENQCFDQGGKKPPELPPSSSKKDRILVLIDCVLPIVRRYFSDDEIDFMIAFRASRGNVNLTAHAMDKELPTVYYYQNTVLTKMEKLAKLLIRLLKKAG
ncbi:MAG: hypothetical protein HY762_05645 [Planctomycetes bacterium]|nr:hypothetical protein [Planctomycetota bacterium]